MLCVFLFLVGRTASYGSWALIEVRTASQLFVQNSCCKGCTTSYTGFRLDIDGTNTQRSPFYWGPYKPRKLGETVPSNLEPLQLLDQPAVGQLSTANGELRVDITNELRTQNRPRGAKKGFATNKGLRNVETIWIA